MTRDIEERIFKDAVEAKRVFDLARQQPFSFNENYRLVHSQDRDDTHTLLEFANSVQAANADVRYWYGNGPDCTDRPGVLAAYHPMIHKRDGEWERICETATQLAQELTRWIWVTLGEDCWVRILVGHDPADDREDGPLYVNGKYQNDQYITTFSPTGEEKFIGCS